MAARYSGTLNEPMVSLGLRGQTLKEKLAKLINEEKIPALFEHYQVAPDDPTGWYQLAVKLALTHVPGFLIITTPKRRGRKRTWQAGLGDDLIRDVEAVKRDMGLKTTREAIAALKRASDKGWTTYTRQSLETRHREAVKRNLKRLQLARALMTPADGLFALGGSFAIPALPAASEGLHPGGLSGSPAPKPK